MAWLTGGIVLAAGAGLVALGLAGLLRPEALQRVLRGFAQSARVHYLELFLRLVAGAAFILHAPRLEFAQAFRLFGWLLVITTLGMLLLPWQWHRRFAHGVIPVVIRFLPTYALASVALGGFILWSLAQA